MDVDDASSSVADDESVEEDQNYIDDGQDLLPQMPTSDKGFEGGLEKTPVASAKAQASTSTDGDLTVAPSNLAELLVLDWVNFMSHHLPSSSGITARADFKTVTDLGPSFKDGTQLARCVSAIYELICPDSAVAGNRTQSFRHIPRHTHLYTYPRPPANT